MIDCEQSRVVWKINHVGDLRLRFSKCSVNLGAPRAIRLLIEIPTWIILQLSKEAITATNTSESLHKALPIYSGTSIGK